MTEKQTETVLITGASSGIGAALARRYAGLGAQVVLLARRVDKIDALAHELSKGPGRALALNGDVRRKSDLDRAVAQTIKAYGRIDTVIANAGFMVTGPIEKLGPEDFRRQLDTNVMGSVNTLYACLEELKKTRGRFAIVGSAVGYIATPGLTPYSMSKFALRALAECLDIELHPHGISVTLLSPGYVASEIRQIDNEGTHHPEVPDSAPAWMLMPADRAARKMESAITRRKSHAIITKHARLGIFMSRHFPRLVKMGLMMPTIKEKI